MRALAWGAVTAGRAGETLAALGELADAGVVGFSDDGAGVPSAALVRSALSYAGALGLPLVDHAEDATQTAGAEANDGYVATVLGLRGWPAAAEETAVARDLAILAEVVRDVPARPAPPDASLDGRRAGPRPAGEGGRPAGDLRRHAAPPGTHRRVARRRPALGVGGDRRSVGRRHRARSWPRRTRRRSGSIRRCAPWRTRPRAGRRCSMGPPTRSPRTTRRTRASTRTSSSGWRRTGSAGSRRRSESCSRRSTPG